MGSRKGPVKINSYGLDFKLRAVQLSSQPGVLIKDVAESLGIHPFMLSKWRKQVRDGELSESPPPMDGERSSCGAIPPTGGHLQVRHPPRRAPA